MRARLSHLDALRGLAAAVVAAFRFMRAFTPELLGPSWIDRSALAGDSYAFAFALGALVALARRSGLRDLPLPAALLVAGIASRNLLDRPSQAMLARNFSRNSAAPPRAR